MDKITLNNAMHNTATILPNEFIDKYMLKANGEYVKIYLLILRLTSSNVPVHIDQLADTLELSRKDILPGIELLEESRPSFLWRCRSRRCSFYRRRRTRRGNDDGRRRYPCRSGKKQPQYKGYGKGHQRY